MYKVIEVFEDLKDIDAEGTPHRYEKGDAYPRDGVNPPEERFLELSGNQNKRGKPLIAPIAGAASTRKSRRRK